MPMINEIKGNLISLALEGKFDVIGHGCNCFCTMKRGLAPQMAAAFGCDEFYYEDSVYKGDIAKLGCIDYESRYVVGDKDIFVVNMYTQFHWSELSRFEIPLDYDALKLCLVKMNHIFKGDHIGLPWVGCGLAGGNKDIVRYIIEDALEDCTVTIVNYEL
jgi:O-acetyl-ADP-ribose deacetylase (regulator of RNase III)